MSGKYKSKPLFKREFVDISEQDTFWARIGVAQSEVQSFQLVWHDATSSTSGIKVYSSNLADPQHPSETSDAVDLEQWYEETSITMTGPSASAAGSEVIHIGVLGCRWLLFEYVGDADSYISGWIHGKD